MRAWQILRAIVPACFGSTRGEKLRAAFLRLGGALPKLGQQLSVRSDWLPGDVCDALAKLQSDKGQGTVGYVLFVGGVAVKRIHPGRREEIERDLRLLARVAAVWRFIPVLRKADLRDFVREAKRVFAEALDLRYEGEATQALRPEAAKFGLRVSRVLSATSEELVTQRVFGWTLTEVIADPWLSARFRSRLRRHAQNAVDFLLYVILERNLFPYDLHPGNLMIDGAGDLWLIDLATGTTDDGFLRPFTRFINCLAERDWTWAADNFMRLQGGVVRQTPVGKLFGFGEKKKSKVSKRLARVLAAWAQDAPVAALPYVRRALNTLVQQLVKVTTFAGASLSWAWLKIQQSFMTLEAFVEAFCPSINYLRVAERYVEDFKRRNPYAWKDRLTEMLDMAHQQLDFATDEGLMTALFQGR